MTTTDTFNAAFTRALAVMNAEPEFRTDSKGRVVRVFTKANPLTREIVRDFYKGVRAVDEYDALETLGYDGFRAQVAAGYLVPAKGHAGMFFITDKAAANYNLRKPVLANGYVCDFYKGA